MVQICSNWSRDGWKGDSGLKGASPRPESTGTGLEMGIIEARIGDPGAGYGEYHHDRERVSRGWRRGSAAGIGCAPGWRRAHHCESGMVKLRLFAARERRGSPRASLISYIIHLRPDLYCHS